MNEYYKAVKVSGVKHDTHRYIMEQHLGRKLNFNEVVHHIDGNRLNNRIDNLCVMTRAEHSRMHQRIRPVSEKTRQRLSAKMTGKPNMSCRKLTKELVFDIVRLGINSIPSRKIAGILGVSRSAVYSVLTGCGYKDWAMEAREHLKKE